MSWYKLNRDFLQWEWYKREGALQVFLFLLLNANYEPKNWEGITIERGQVVTSVSKICEGTGLSTQKTRTLLKLLEKSQFLTIKSTNKYSVITICKYDSYADEGFKANKQTNKQLTNNQQTTNNNIRNNRKNRKNINNILLADESAKTNTEEDNFIDELKEQYTRVMSMKDPLTYEQCEELGKSYSKDQIRDILSRMENYVKLHKNCQSAYRTALNWLKRDNNKAI